MSRMAEIYGGRFMKAADLAGKAHLFTIARALIEALPDFNNPNQQNDRLVISLDGTGKDVAVNATSAKELMALYGDDERAYVGKQIVVYPQRMNVSGKMIDVVMLRAPRVRPVAPSPAPPPGPPPIDPHSGDFDDDIPF